MAISCKTSRGWTSVLPPSNGVAASAWHLRTPAPFSVENYSAVVLSNHHFRSQQASAANPPLSVVRPSVDMAVVMASRIPGAFALSTFTYPAKLTEIVLRWAWRMYIISASRAAKSVEPSEISERNFAVATSSRIRSWATSAMWCVNSLACLSLR